MKRILLLLMLVLLASFSWFKGSSPDMCSEIRHVQDFSKIYFCASGNLYIVQGDKEEILIEANKDQIENIETEVSKRTLKIEEKAMGWLKGIIKDPINIYVYVKNIDEIHLAGKGNLVAKDPIIGKNLEIKVSGSNNVDLEMQCENLVSNIGGTAEYNLSGSVIKQDINISGSCTYNAADLSSEKTSINIKGWGDVYVDVHNKLDVSITGKGTVRYKGDPKISQKIIGKGKIKKLKT